MPGGCNIGSRKIDLHLKGLERMGASFSYEHGYLQAEARQLRGAVVSLDFPSVGATENVLMAAVGAARHDRDRERRPRARDRRPRRDAGRDGRAGSRAPAPRTIEIEGGDGFAPVTHRVVPDRIEAGTFAHRRVRHAAATCCWPGRAAEHLDLFLAKLADAGAAHRRRATTACACAHGRGGRGPSTS